MARKRKPLLDPLVYAAARCFLGVLGALPLPLSRQVAIAFGRVVMALTPRLHRVGLEQIDMIYGDTLTSGQKRAILLDAMDNMAIVAAEFGHGPRLAKEGFPNFKVTGREHADLSRGALIIGAHLANWECLAGAYGALYPKFSEVVRPFDYPPLDRFIDGTRRAMNIGTIPKTGATAEIVEALHDGTHVGILVDQCPRESGVPITFFGRKCWATIGPAMLAARTQAPVHFIAIRRLPDYTYEYEISPALPFVSTGNPLADLVHNTQLCQDAVESNVRANPGQWLWFHRRWKERPRLQEEWDARLAKAAGKG